MIGVSSCVRAACVSHVQNIHHDVKNWIEVRVQTRVCEFDDDLEFCNVDDVVNVGLVATFGDILDAPFQSPQAVFRKIRCKDNLTSMFRHADDLKCKSGRVIGPIHSIIESRHII